MKIANNYPIKLTPARAWRTYLGGQLISKLHDQESIDDHFPEEWIMSTVAARNAGREEIIDEGLSKLAEYDQDLRSLLADVGESLVGTRHYAKYQNDLGVLVKLIDSAERLTIQVHPDKQSARELFDSQFGKTECWHILGGREINGEKPCIYMGFKPGITRSYWQELFEKQDYDAMLAAMHKIEVKAGETYLIKGGVAHAIGAGCFLMEIQEPTDYTIRVEKVTPAGFEIADYMCHQGLGFDRMFECFHYDGITLEQALALWQIKPQVIDQQAGGKCESVISYAATEMFSLNMINVQSEYQLDLNDTYCGIYVLEGSGSIEIDGKLMPVTKAEQFFIPALVKSMKITANSPLSIAQYFGPQV